MGNLTLYVYGNGDFMYEVLTSVNFFMNNAHSFFLLAAMLFLVVFAFESTGVLPSRGYDWAKFLRMYIVMSLFVTTPWMGAVNVHDVITNQDRTFNFRDGKLPIGMIVPIAWTSDIIYRTIQLYQKNFEIDENLNYSYSGMNFGANFILSLDNVSSYMPNFDYNLDRYMQNCGFPLANKAGALSELRQSKDIFATLTKYTSASRYVQQTDLTVGKELSVMSCKNALELLNSYYTDHADEILRKNASMIGIDSGEAFTRYVNAANASSIELLNISQGAAAAMKQAIGMNVMMASLKNGALGVGNGSLALAAYDAEQFQQYKVTGALSGESTARTIPVVVATFFALMFMIYPVVVFLAVVMGSYTMVGMLFKVIIALNLIPLIYEILNFVGTFYIQKKFGTVITGQGFNYDISTSLYSFTDNMIVASNWFATMTPMIAWALVSGTAFSLTALFDHVNSPAQKAVDSIGTEASRGNQSIGNATVDSYSYNNLNSNKLDNQPAFNTGSPLMKNTTPYGVETTIGDGNNSRTFGIQYKDQLNTQLSLSDMSQHSLQNSQDSSRRTMNQIGHQWQHQSQRTHELSDGIQSGQDWAKNISSGEKKDIAHAQNLQSQLGFTFMGSGVSSSSSDSVQKALGEYKEVSNRLSHSTNQNVRDAFSDSQSLSETSSYAVEQSVAISRAQSDMQTNSDHVNSDFTSDWANHMRSQGIDPMKLTNDEQYSSAKEYSQEYLHQKYGINDNLQKPTSASTISDPTLSHSVNSSGIAPVDANNIPFMEEQKKMQKNTKTAENNITQTPVKTVANQIREAGGIVQDGLGTVADAVAHPDRIINNNNNAQRTNKNSDNKPKIPE